jgi:hypothetical protein
MHGSPVRRRLEFTFAMILFAALAAGGFNLYSDQQIADTASLREAAAQSPCVRAGIEEALRGNDPVKTWNIRALQSSCQIRLAMEADAPTRNKLMQMQRLALTN